MNTEIRFAMREVEVIRWEIIHENDAESATYNVRKERLTVKVSAVTQTLLQLSYTDFCWESKMKEGNRYMQAFVGWSGACAKLVYLPQRTSELGSLSQRRVFRLPVCAWWCKICLNSTGLGVEKLAVMAYLDEKEMRLMESATSGPFGDGISFDWDLTTFAEE